MGHHAESAGDAHVALHLAVTNPPALALLDYRMPGMDGLELFGAMRDALGERCPKVVFVSASPPEEVKARTSGAAHAAGYVRKPFHLDDLSRTVTEALAA